MTKSQLIDVIAQKSPAIPRRQVEAIVNAIFERMVDALRREERIEIRGFGCFAIRVREERDARNPKTGKKVHVPTRRMLSFTVGKELRDRLNRPAQQPEPMAAEPEHTPQSPARPSAPPAGAGEPVSEPLAAAPAASVQRYTLS